MSILDTLYTTQMSPREFNYETMSMPPWTYYLTPQDVDDLHYIATSKKLAGNIPKKQQYIKQIMTARNFTRFGGGTNRVVYRHYEDPRFVAKIAIDQVGLTDNPAEFQNQFLIKPFCAKMFQVTPCGTVGFAEKLIPLKNVEEFKSVAEDVFDVIYNCLLGKYILEDFGTKFFMNWGIRPGYGVALLDYPYVYELDGNKIFCNKRDPFGHVCGGEIDYDPGFNHLYCTKCGKKYDAIELKKYKDSNEIVIRKGGAIPMKVSVMNGDEVIFTANESDVIASQHAQKMKKIHNNAMKVCVMYGDEPMTTIESADADEKNSDENMHVTDSVKLDEEIKITPIAEAENKQQIKEEKKTETTFVTGLDVINDSKSDDSIDPTVSAAKADITVTSNARSNSVTIDSKFIPNKEEY